MMMRLLRGLVLGVTIGLGLSVWRPCLAGAEPSAAGYGLVVPSAKRVRAELTFTFQAPGLLARDWVVYAARLPELPGQVEVRSALAPGGRLARETGALGRPLLVTRVPVQGTKWRRGLSVRVDYEATLLERRLEPRGADATPVAPLAPKERRAALAGGQPFDFSDRSFQDWLDEHKLRRKAEERDDVDFARRVFLGVKEALPLAALGKPDHQVSHVCTSGKTDGAGLAIVFVAVLRANGVPARVLAGRWALPTADGANAAEEPHVKAEFFATGVGWVPADIASAALVEKSEQGLEFFGVDTANFLALHVDTDVEFDTVHFGRKRVEWLQAPSFWVLGEGSFDGLTNPSTSKITVEPIDPPGPSRKPGGKTATPKRAAPATRVADKTKTVVGLVIDKQEGSIAVKADGEEEPQTYVLGEKRDPGMLQEWRRIFTVGRVQLSYTLDGNTRRLVRIMKLIPKGTGTATGEVVHNYGWWVELKTTGGPNEGYAVNFPTNQDDERRRAAKAALMEMVKGLKPGEVVTIRFTTDFERHRIEGLEKTK